ncbi:dynamin family protein [Xenococcus sp. PCC 7305]|uniref:dynamin family protein n=1 Tax=Xenococcus sp. PCC 7305 TaxID=102125 RepID=UPI0002AC9A5A|nr:dynamin family protein [Xenococcus sp. PCC 7305]ELS01092.1 dynamin family protein [Xenococcus sp. PCC 7305]
MPLTLSNSQQELFDRSLQNIEKVESLFVEAQSLFPDFEPDIVGIKQQLKSPFSIFICGEFNAGKSSLLNHLGESAIAPVGILPTTKAIESYNPEGLGGLVFIDSPGTNSIIDQHQELTENYLKQADIILFLTSIERPLSKSEQDFLTIVDNTWARKVIVAVNKIDLATPEEIDQVTNYIAEGLSNIFTEAPPIFPISSHSGAGMEEFKGFLVSFLAEKERMKLKLQGPQNSLLVYLEQLVSKNQVVQEKLQAEKAIFDRSVRRITERLEEYKMLFGIFQGNIEDLFRNLTYAVYKIIDNKLNFVSVARKRITNEDDGLEEKLTTAIKEVQLDKNLQDIFKEATTTFVQYRDRIIRETTEDIATAIEINQAQLTIPILESEAVDVKAMSENIKTAADTGLNNCGKLGMFAVVSGFSGQILFTAASLDASAFALSVVFGVLSFNALPRQNQKVKEQLSATFLELKQNYTDTLWQALANELNESLAKVMAVIQPQQEELETKIQLAASIEENIESNKLEINKILNELEQLSEK